MALQQFRATQAFPLPREGFTQPSIGPDLNASSRAQGLGGRPGAGEIRRDDAIRLEIRQQLGGALGLRAVGLEFALRRRSLLA